jgi:cyclic beta-1,2-glucan synthetase
LLEKVCASAAALVRLDAAPGLDAPAAARDLPYWCAAFVKQAESQKAQLLELAPWLPLLQETPSAMPGEGAAWERVLRYCLVPSSPAALAEGMEAAAADVRKLRAAPGAPVAWLDRLAAALEASAAQPLLLRGQTVAARARAAAKAMDFRFLYNDHRHLFAVGYNLSHGRLDNAHYDLLASEACLTSFLTVARGDVPRRHWFQLGRPLTRAAGRVGLVSWGGTMFEYLMPRLLLAPLPGTLLDESHRMAVARQAEYGRQCGIPWGVSESAYAFVDGALNYQYQAFGVPGLGLKRGLGKDLVIAPYATVLAVMIDPHLALRNFTQLARVGAEGRHGFYEALDYTTDTRERAHEPRVVKCFMAHHQAMSFLALANGLFHDRTARRFHDEPVARATDLFLQERMPSDVPLIQPHGDEADAPAAAAGAAPHLSRRLTTPHTAHPRTQILSNGRYSVVVTNAGGSRSTCDGLDVTRWREDAACDCWGQFVYVRDLRTGQAWSAAYQPLGREADAYEVVFATDKATFRRMDNGVETRLEITVSPENRAEVRRLTFTNHNAQAHDLEVTSYAEVVLGPHGGDLAHPAFGKLFLETEFVEGKEALLCRRRPRSPEQKPVWAVHVLALEGEAVGEPQFETDRMKFLGRGRTPARPAALDAGFFGSTPLSGTTGAVIDPVFSLRRRVRVAPDASVSIAFTTGLADTHEEAHTLADQYHDFHGVTRAFELAWAHSQVELRHLQLSAEEAHLFQRLAANIIFPGAALRVPEAIAANRLGQPGLWRHGISGDLPIVLVRVSEPEELGLVRQALAAHVYWRLKGLAVDLVILNEVAGGYFEDLHQLILGLVRASDDRGLVDKPGGVFVRKAAQFHADDLTLLRAAARCELEGGRGSLASQIDLPPATRELPAPLTLPRRLREAIEPLPETPLPDGLLFFNGHGGFTPDGREYVVRVREREDVHRELRNRATPDRSVEADLPPAPWSNVIANPSFGFFVTEAGGGNTWAGNSQAHRLTPWSNDPVSDPPAEVVYLRDEETGACWSATPLPIGMPGTFVVRHGQGYSRFEHAGRGLRHELTFIVPPDDPVKLIRLKVRNEGRRPRKLSATFFAAWVLGPNRDQAAPHVVTWLDESSGALLARNTFNPSPDFGVGFAHALPRPASVTGDRTEFLGRNGSVQAPAALQRAGLSGAVGAALEPCAALQVRVDLAPGEEKEVVFLLGAAASSTAVREVLGRYRDAGKVEDAFRRTRELWDRVLGAVQVETPNVALNLLLNRWLVYQVLSCRLWGRSAFYQSGGAYGFRDQLQDVLALLHAKPDETRAQILRAAARQFEEGDVQHWWHPPFGGGVRTHCSDDFLWLPFAVCHYVTATGDAGILDEKVSFLRAPALRPDQEDDYRVPDVSPETATLYEHCVRAIEHSLPFGPHGLPRIGTCDWNDGMNRVGPEGKGESVWNGWFLITIFDQFARLAESRGDGGRAVEYHSRRESLRAAMEEHAWDGAWYRRAYFDDGTPLGSATNDECRIDSLPQSWAVISGAADPERARAAMAEAEKELVRDAERLILLFTPPFDHGSLQPGYIKGYIPGIRENGGQYTHAAIWVAQATALLGQGTRAIELLDLLNPVNHAKTDRELMRYRVEPYVIAADIYGRPPHTGRGGWTWYTGSASWFYRVALETVLGVQRRGDKLVIDPCVARDWPGFTITYRFGSATYRVRVDNAAGVERGVKWVEVDGVKQEGNAVPLADDGRTHEVVVVMG